MERDNLIKAQIVIILITITLIWIGDTDNYSRKLAQWWEPHTVKLQLDHCWQKTSENV